MTRFVGSSIAEEIFGSPNRDAIFGEDGDDRLDGNGGNDRIIGGAGNDALCGCEGTDTLRGGAGDDILETSWGVVGEWEVAHGGAGNDRLALTGGYIEDSIAYGVSNVRGYGGAGDDYIRGGMGENLLYGGQGNDYLLAYGGYLSGGAGNDELRGSGIVELTGGKGNDRLHAYLQGEAEILNPDGRMEPATAILTGGFGADSFNVRAVHDVHQSVAFVRDFRPEEGDRLAFDAFDAFELGEYAGGSVQYSHHEVFWRLIPERTG
jgi:hypothetical protein